MKPPGASDHTARERIGGKRRQGREMALQMLYQSDLGGATLPQVLRHFNPVDVQAGDEDAPPRPGGTVEKTRAALDYARQLVEGTVNPRQELDELIRGQADNWRLERMSAVDRNVLRLAAYELLYEPDVPQRVVLDEAIELAKKFGSEQSGRFVNGLLDGLLKAPRLAGRAT